MTKKDGDRLRAMKRDLETMASEYGAGSVTQRGAWSICEAIDYVLRGIPIRVNPR